MMPGNQFVGNLSPVPQIIWCYTVIRYERKVLKMKEEMKVLDTAEMEQVTGGTIDWRHFPKEVRDAIENEQQHKDGGATGSW